MSIAPEVRYPEERVDVRLVAVDMDGTLLDGEGRIPEGFWPLVEELDARGAVVVPASGRQYATLRQQFGEASSSMGFIAENGTLVAYHDEVLATDTLDPAVVHELVSRVRRVARERDLGVVVCGVESAYVERTDRAFRSRVEPYYAELADVEDLMAVTEGVLKVALFDFEDAEHGAYPHLTDFCETHQVVVSSRHWIDVMNPGVHKGAGLDRLRALLGLERDQCVAFGDYLNDLQLVQAAGVSFAMANAHPDVLAAARYVAPPHTEYGVVTAMERLLA